MQYSIDVINHILVFSIFALSLNLLLGYTGQISVAHAAFGGVGGYTAIYLATNFGLPFWPSLLAGVVLAGVCGVVVSFPALRMSAGFLILLTIAVTEIVVSIATSVNAFGGTHGLINPHGIAMFGINLRTPAAVLPFLVVVTLIIYLMCRRLGESPYGRILRAIREDEVATRALGKPVVRYKVVVFGITSAMAGLAGGLLAFYDQLAATAEFGFDQSVAIIVMIIFGGMGNLFGSVLGAAIVELFAPVLQAIVKISPEHAALVRLLVYGLALVVVMRLRPQGLLPEGVSLPRVLADFGAKHLGLPVKTSQQARLATGGPDDVSTAPAPPTRTAPGHSPASERQGREGSTERLAAGAGVRVDDQPPGIASPQDSVLRVSGLTKRFGGVTAVKDMDFELARGQITALVGPNGAGKTTVFSLLNGSIRPDAGAVYLESRDITAMKPTRSRDSGSSDRFKTCAYSPDCQRCRT
jgi:branched-chain amino acid transport system permease protein